MYFNPKEWDKKQAARQASFLQSSGWGNFQERIGARPHYLMKNKWSCLLLEKKTPLGKYLIAPYGPTLNSPNVIEESIEQLKAYGRSNGADWLRLEPMVSGGPSAGLRADLSRMGALPANHNRQPDMTRIIDLAKPADEILASISQSTRSLIRKNQRENFLTFKTSTSPDDIKLFIRMLGSVTKRNSVFFFSDDYFKKEAETLMPAGMMVHELALLNDTPVASALFIDYGITAAYTYAASLPEARQTSASALLLYQAMLNAKARGLKKLDLFGIAPDDALPSHPWRGFTDFKKKFGGEVIEYTGTWDIPLSGKYRLYRAAHRARRTLKRH